MPCSCSSSPSGSSSGHEAGAERGLQLVEHAVEVGPRLVLLVDEHEPRDAGGDALRPRRLGADLDAVDGADDEHGEVGDGQRGVEVAGEVGVAGRVDEVDLVRLAVGRLPLERRDGERQRHRALQLLGLGVADRRPVLDPPRPRQDARRAAAAPRRASSCRSRCGRRWRRCGSCRSTGCSIRTPQVLDAAAPAPIVVSRRAPARNGSPARPRRARSRCVPDRYPGRDVSAHVDRGRLRHQLLAGRGDVRAVPERPGLGGGGLAGVLRRLQVDQPRAPGATPPPRRPPSAEPRRAGDAAAATPARHRAGDARPAATATPAPRADAPMRPLGRRRRRRAGQPVATGPPGEPARAEAGTPIRGVGATIAANMERSLTVPTATSFRNVPAKLLEVNRKVINGYRQRSGLGKVSFTHLIGYAIVRAIADAVPAMKQHVRRGRRRQAPPRQATTPSTWASPSTSRSPTAAARSSCRSSATPTRSTSPASSAPTRS